MQHLFSAEGRAALAAALRRRPLLAFDFDGTLAPIVARPDDARILPDAAARLRVLATRLPLAIVTGRAVHDVRGRLGFEPRYIVGNHGAEGLLEPAQAAALVQRLDPLRARLRASAAELAATGITVEDKGASVALHYRRAEAPDAAQALIDRLLQPRDDALQVFGGKMVVNIAAAGAPDKAAAVHELVARSGADAALFAGDDVNDEPVFASAGPHWLTIRVGRDEAPSHARFSLDDPGEVATLLEQMLRLLPAPDGR